MGDLGGVEESGSDGAGDGFDQHAVGYAGDEVADVLVTGERGHGLAVSVFGFLGGIVVVLALFRGGLHRVRVGPGTSSNGVVC